MGRDWGDDGRIVWVRVIVGVEEGEGGEEGREMERVLLDIRHEDRVAPVMAHVVDLISYYLGNENTKELTCETTDLILTTISHVSPYSPEL